MNRTLLFLLSLAVCARTFGQWTTSTDTVILPAPATNMVRVGPNSPIRSGPSFTYPSTYKMHVDGDLSATTLSANGMVSVTRFGARPNDNSNPRTDTCIIHALQYIAHLDSLIKNDTNNTVLFPPGKFYITLRDSLTIPDGTILLGSNVGMHLPDSGRGTILIIKDSTGLDSSDALIRLNKNATIKGITIVLADVTPANIGDHSNHPWLIQLSHYANVEDITIVNAPRGILSKGNQTYISNVCMTALECGIRVDESHSDTRLRNIQIQPSIWMDYFGWDWLDTTPSSEFMTITQHTMNNLTAYQFVISEMQFVDDVFAIYARCGMSFENDSVADDTNYIDFSPSVMINNSGFDFSQHPIEVYYSHDWAGIAFNNCYFVGRNNFHHNSGALKPNTGSVSFTNCRFHSASGGNVANPDDVHSLIYSGSDQTLMFNSCIFDWDPLNYGWGCFTLFQGTTLISNCVFRQKIEFPAMKHFHFTGGLPFVMISNSHFHNELKTYREPHDSGTGTISISNCIFPNGIIQDSVQTESKP